jgi:hypothetical protein
MADAVALSQRRGEVTRDGECKRPFNLRELLRSCGFLERQLGIEVQQLVALHSFEA